MTAPTPTRKHRGGFRFLPNYLVLILLTIFALGPIVVLGFNSLKGRTEIGRNPIGFPKEPLWSNYTQAWELGRFAVTTRNSGLLVLLTVVTVLLLGGMAAYSLAKMDLPGAGLLMLYLLVGSALPIQLFMVPLFFLWQRVGLTNSIPGLALIYIAINAPLSIFLLRSYMIQLPRDFEEAARIDGAGEFQIYRQIIVPLTWPGFLTVGLVVALAVWNEFLLATVFLTDQSKFTIVTSYYNFMSRFTRDWGLTSAAAMMMIVPIIVIFLSLQKQFIAGLTSGGLKG